MTEAERKHHEEHEAIHALNHRVNVQILTHKRQVIAKNLIFCFLFQIILLALIFYEQTYYYGCKFFVYEFMNLQLIARLICGTILHLCVVDD